MLKRKIFWYFCLIVEFMIILIFAVREYFRPTYHYYLQFSAGILLSQVFLALSIFFEVIYLIILVKGYGKMGAPFRRIVEAYTGVLITAGYLNSPGNAAYTPLNNLLIAIVNGLTAVHYDFFSQISGIFRIFREYTFWAVLTAIDWPLRMAGPLSYAQKMLLYGGILAGMNLLCVAWMEDAEERI